MKNKLFFLVLSISLIGKLTAQQNVGEKTGYNPNNVVAFAHMTNTINAVRWAMSKGANGVEMDLRFDDDGNPKEFRHGGVCDCSCALTWGTDMVCSALNYSCDQCPCNAKENAQEMTTSLSLYPTQLAVIYIDSKVDGNQKKLSECGKNVINLLDNYTFSGGYTGQVIIAAPSTDQLEYIKAAITAADASPNKSKYYFAFDGEGDHFMKAMRPLIPLTKNRVYATGISACAASTYYDAITLAAYNEKIGVLASTGIWTLDKKSSMEDYIKLGVSAIVTNYPSYAVEVFKEKGKTLAKPGLALLPATSDALTDKIGVGSPCNSNGDCQNDACGRQTAADNAPLICCPSGKIITYAAYDYCTGMADGSVCWSDSMCATGYCRGNNGGLKKGVCGKLPVNGSCSKNSECENNACGRQTAADNAPLICCPSGKIITYAGYDYCGGMSDGSTCWSDSMCASDYCRGNNGGLKKGICGKLPVNSSCSKNSECANNACGRQTAADDAPLICCPSGKIITYAGYDYCGGMPNGSTCWSDSMCASDYCKGNMGGLKKGTCR